MSGEMTPEKYRQWEAQDVLVKYVSLNYYQRLQAAAKAVIDVRNGKEDALREAATNLAEVMTSEA